MANDRLAQLFVEIAGDNKTGPVFRKVKEDLVQLMADARAAKAAIGATFAMPGGPSLPSTTTPGGAGGVGTLALGFAPAKSITDDVAKLQASLKKAHETVGMTANQVKLWDLYQRGATRSQLGMLPGMIQQEALQIKLQQSAAALNQSWGDLRRNSYVLMYAAAGATAAIGGFVAAASPDIWRTFTGSITDASGAIGTAFTPAIVEISYKIQQFADWFDNLNDSTKQNVSSWTLWSVGIFAGSVAIVVLMRGLAGAVSMLKLLWSVKVLVTAQGAAMNISLLSSGAAMTGLTAKTVGATAALRAFAMAHPVALIASLAATLGILALGFGQMGQAADDASEKIQTMEMVIERLQSGGNLTRREFNELFSLERRLQLANSAPREQMRTLRAQEQRLEAQAALEAGGDLRLATRLRELEEPGGSMNLWEQARRSRGRADAIEGAGLQRPAWGSHSFREIGPEAIQRLADSVRGQATTTNARLEAVRNLIGQGGVPAHLLQTGANPLRNDVRFQSRMSSVEDVWKNIQMSALSMSPMQAQAEQRHREQITVQERTARAAEAIAGAIPPAAAAIANQMGAAP